MGYPDGDEEDDEDEEARLPTPPRFGIHTKSLLSLPPEASMRSSHDHFNPHT